MDEQETLGTILSRGPELENTVEGGFDVNTLTPTLTADSIKDISRERRYIQAIVFGFGSSVSTGDGKFYIHIPKDLNQFVLREVHAEVITAGTTGTTDIQINNVTEGVDMLTTVITIDSGETASDTAATEPVIDEINNKVEENDLIRIDVDAVSTTAPKGLIVTMGLE